MDRWLLFVTNLPGRHHTPRMRTWRALKSAGAAVLRDGVYVLPMRDECRAELNTIAADVHAAGGTAYVLTTEEPAGVNFTALFDRRDDYRPLLGKIAQTRAALRPNTSLNMPRQLRNLRRSFDEFAAIDFFPGEPRAEVEAALSQLEIAANAVMSPGEPHAVEQIISRRRLADYRGRIWATRRRPWVDRLASAWLIRRFIDPKARILWVKAPADCPRNAVGFDFDGATFSHVGNHVTFEVLISSFRLRQAGLPRIAALVHYLDVGGAQPPEADGVATVLRGLRDSIDDDDRLLIAASTVFDGLLGKSRAAGAFQ